VEKPSVGAPFLAIRIERHHIHSNPVRRR
jgi:hypothetical protein